ncbi:fimbrial protein [Serratia marcescens]|nr:fimbrial protein [Serratia marcescens]HAT3516290.1 fimbrial protein [Serratia marcescens]
MTLVSKLKKVLKKKEVAALVASVCLMAYSSGANAFICKDPTGKQFSSLSGGGTLTVSANLTPRLESGQNLVVDLSASLRCRNTDPRNYNDWISITSGSSFGGVLSNFNGTMDYYGSSYTFPTLGNTKEVVINSSAFVGLNIRLLLKPIGAASGVVINKGEPIAILNLYKYSTNPNTGAINGVRDNYKWNIYANNTVFIPTGGCEVSSRNVTVTLPDYPGTAAVPLTVHCGQNQQLAYYLTGTTADTASTIFTNTSSSNPATGVGVQLSNRNGIVATNKNVSLGTVGTSPVSLGLTASYARTTGQVVAGNVQSIIGVTFVYE